MPTGKADGERNGAAAELAQRGIVVYRASRLEALLDPLLRLLDIAPDAVLAPQTLVAAHPGMKQWLSTAIARRRGHAGIAANLDIVLPSAWLDRVAREVLGEGAVALRAYRREHLRWRIHALLDGPDAFGVGSYLDGAASARRRFQLADRLAGLYTQYLVYRPDWLRAWADRARPARDPSVDGGILAPLWRRLRARIGVPHRGEVLGQLVERLQQAASEAPAGDPLHVFGISHLAPSELAVLRAVAQQRLVVLYVPDPCREYWASMPGDRRLLREQVERAPQAPETESLFLEQPHPLLAAWARLGQHFMLALDDIGARVDVRHWEDSIDPERIGNRLQGLQESIRQCAPALMAPRGDAAAERADDTLRVHACHTRVRELEVLRDALLRQLATRPALKPSDIVVMAPDIQAYVPLLPAVFGEAGRHEGPLPYHLADVAVTRPLPLFEAFRRLLDLPQSRVTAAEVADLLAMPPIAARLGLSPADIDVIVGWLDAGRVAWALDATFRARFDVPAIAEHTFAWGMDRMLAGYAMGGGDVGAVILPDAAELAPLGGVSGPQAALLGALDSLLVEVSAWCELATRSRRASQWAEQLERRVESIFLVDPMDREARDARAALLGFIRALAGEPMESGLDPMLEFDVVRELLLSRLSATPARQRFLMGGVTFCGMVPQRAIPFSVVAVLGLNDGEFPRNPDDGGLDPMRRHRRLGDRDARSDDRYLFLETVMSARVALHLSHIGEGVRDGKPRNPAAPLAELMAALDAAADHAGGAVPAPEHGDGVADRGPGDAPVRPWLVRHPLQPFDGRYFDGRDAALFSFRRDFAAMHARSDAASRPAPFVADPSPADTAPAPAGDDEPVALRDVLAFYRDPARELLAGSLGLRLDALAEERLRESEPLEARFEALDQVARHVFVETAMAGELRVAEAEPAWLRLTGLLPPGRAGQTAWERERAKVDSLLAVVQDHPLFAGALPPARPRPVRAVLAGGILQGEVHRVHEADGIHWLLEIVPGKFHAGGLARASEEALGFKARIGFFLEWALLRLADRDGHRSVRACIVCDGRRDGWEDGFNIWDDAFGAADAAARATMLADLERRAAGLLAFWRRCREHPQWYFPAASWAALGGDARAVRATWCGSDHAVGERDYAPGYARVLAGERDFGEGRDYVLLRANAAHLRALIDLAATPERTA